MMRNDSIKRTIWANRPVPPPIFTRSIYQALNDLPKKKKANVLQLLATPVIVLAATAVVYVTVINHSALSFLQGPAAEGGAAPAPTAGEVIPGNTAEGDATAMSEVTPTPAPTPEETAVPGTNDATPQPTHEPDQSTAEPEGTPSPTPTSPEQAATAAAPEMTAAPGADADSGNGSGRGKMAFGNAADLKSIEKTGSATIYTVEVEASAALDRFYDNSKKSDGKVSLDPSGTIQLLFIICTGQVSSDFIRDDVGYDKMNLLVAANDDWKDKGVFVKGINGDMTREENGNYLFHIWNGSPSYQPTSNFTIITQCDGTGDQQRTYYALPVAEK